MRTKLELQVRDVQAAYWKVAWLGARYGAYRVIDSVHIGVADEGQAYVMLRVPVHRYQDLLLGTLQVGRLVRLDGSADQVGEQYYCRSRDLRALANEEEALMLQLRDEDDENSRGELRYEIYRVRSCMRTTREPLENLRKRAYWPRLEVTVRRQPDAVDWTGAALSVAAWVTAVVLAAVPVVILALVWRRRWPA